MFNLAPAWTEFNVLQQIKIDIEEKMLSAAQQSVEELVKVMLLDDNGITGVYFGRSPENPTMMDVFVCRGEERTPLTEESVERLRWLNPMFVELGSFIALSHADGCAGFEIYLSGEGEGEEE